MANSPLIRKEILSMQDNAPYRIYTLKDLEKEDNA